QPAYRGELLTIIIHAAVSGKYVARTAVWKQIDSVKTSYAENIRFMSKCPAFMIFRAEKA
ncbi:hypothetical protein ABE387_17890, partial [Bacillus licheniformis]